MAITQTLLPIAQNGNAGRSWTHYMRMVKFQETA